MELSDVENACGYTFRDKELLRRALTLSSYDNYFNNESLECLGDSLLGFIVAEKCYAEGLSEGQITKKKQELLSDDAMRPVSEKLGLDKYLLHSKGDTNNKKSIPSAYEALTAAIYLDGGLDAVKKFAYATLAPAPQPINYIGALQEFLQAHGEPVPVYEHVDVGTPQIPRLKVSVTIRGTEFCAEDVNIATAKRKAARAAYEHFVVKT